MRTLAQGRRGKAGLEARGYRCIEFPQISGKLDERIERFADFLEGVVGALSEPAQIITLGYSLGGLVVRGFLRRYPERSSSVAHTIQLGTPNWGLTVDMLPMLTAFLHLRDQAADDLDVESDFMRWLNGTGGHWEGKGKNRNWILNAEPWVAPPGASLLSIYGAVPHFGGDNDGIVWKDSATLGDRIPSIEMKAERANHLNLIGAWNPGTLLIKGFLFDDKVWPAVISKIAAYVNADAVPT